MISSIKQSSTRWYQAFSPAPYSDGAKRIKKAWDSVDPNQIYHTKLKLSEKIVLVLTGMVFLVPLLNIILWLTLHALGKTSSFSVDSGKTPSEAWPEVEEAAKLIPIFEAPVLQIPDEKDKPNRVESARIHNKVNNDLEYITTNTVEYFDDVIIVKNNSTEDNSESIYNTDWELQTMHYVNPKEKADVHLTREKNTIKITGKYGSVKINKTRKLPSEKSIWIQQPSFGARPFVLSNENDLYFYGIDPSKPDMDLREAKLSKDRVELMAGQCQIVKVDTMPASKLYKAVVGTVSQNWFKVNKARKTAIEIKSKVDVHIPALFSYKSQSKLLGG